MYNTHQWYVYDLDLLHQVFPRIARDFEVIYSQLPRVLLDHTKTKAIVTDQFIAMNSPDLEENDPFVLSSNPKDFNYHHTHDDGRTTYYGICQAQDPAFNFSVKATLALFRWHAGDAVTVSSDETLPDWDSVSRFIVKHLGYPVDPFFILNLELYLIRDGRERYFIVEGNNPELVTTRLKNLAESEGFPFEPPFTLLKRVPNLDQHQAIPSLRGIYVPVNHQS